MRSRASPAWRTCSSTWRSRAPRPSARRTIRPRPRPWRGWTICSWRSKQEKRKGDRADPETLKKLQEQFEQAGAGGPEVHRPRRIRRDAHAAGCGRFQRLHQRRCDAVHRQPALEQDRALDDAGSRPLRQSRAAGVLQGEGRRHGGAADDGELADRASVRGVPGHRLPGPSVRRGRHRPHERPADPDPGRGRSLLQEALRPEQSDDRHRRRRRSGEGQAAGPEVLREHPQRPEAGAGRDGGAAAARRAAGDGRGCRPADQF